MVAQGCEPSIWKEEGMSKLKVIFNCTVTLSPAWVTWDKRPSAQVFLSETGIPVSKIQKPTNRKRTARGWRHSSARKSAYLACTKPWVLFPLSNKLYPVICTQEVETGGSRVQDDPQGLIDPVFENKPTNKQKNPELDLEKWLSS